MVMHKPRLLLWKGSMVFRHSVRAWMHIDRDQTGKTARGAREIGLGIVVAEARLI